MAKGWKVPKIKGIQPYKPPKFKDPFKNIFKDPFKDMFKEPKEPKIKEMHSVTLYEKNVAEILYPAIKAKRLVKFYYIDKTKDYEDWRIVEPHLIGELKTTGNIILSGWYLPTQQQIIQYGETEKWGNYILGNVDIKRIEILEQTFSFTRFGYNRNDSRMKIIHCRTL